MIILLILRRKNIKWINLEMLPEPVFAALLSSSIPIATIIVTIVGYLAVPRTVLGAVSQIILPGDK